jgi:hypothetical protein
MKQGPQTLALIIRHTASMVNVPVSQLALTLGLIDLLP